MDSKYDFANVEKELYKTWEESGAFSPQETKSNRSFSIIMPPPNANDPLHIGHALFVALEDVMVRYHRMLGEKTLWLPGTDHAGIETQFVFEKKLAKKKQSRFNFDRKTLYNNIWDYVQENSGVAIDQMKQLGASADWNRYKFTLDEKVVDFVTDTFISLHKDELVYRDLRLVNYCTKCGTSYSELEVNHVERTSPLYYLQYGPFELATTRPETKFGDTAVAVHPDDKRYTKYIGKTITVEGLNGSFELKVIADDFVDPEFGTGVVKITPGHDFNDFEAWQRHKNEIPGIKQVIGYDGKLTAIAGKYQGLNVTKGREAVVADLQEKGLLNKIDEKYSHSIGVCYKCGRVIEPLPLPQFFISVNKKGNSLTEKALKALDTKETVVHGAGRDKILRHWLTNLKDWNISRQIVWGISIPVWYEVDCFEKNITISFINSEGKYTQGSLNELLKSYDFSEIEKGIQSVLADTSVPYSVSKEKPQDGKQYLQETDTFDTWFSSAQWPVVTLKTGEKEDFDRFYPTSVMETGYDILPFWVMRMMLMGIYLTGKSPFKDVYLHGLVRDSKGQKMSKSKGNVINPLEIVEKYSTDALRMALVIRSTPGQDQSIGEGDFKAMRNFGNKIWNAARFVIIFEQEEGVFPQDKIFKSELKNIVSDITQMMNDFKIGMAADYLHNKFWHWYCDECIELTKKFKLSKPALLEGLIVFLKLLHPFMPFVTESVWQELHKQKRVAEPLLISASWPNS